MAEDEIVFGDYSLQPSSYTAMRSEAAMPGTSTLERVFTLLQPPAPPASLVPESERNHGPDPVAEYAIRFDAARSFPCDSLLDALRKIRWPRHLYRPSFYVVTPSGQTTYLLSSGAPAEGIALIAAWRMADLPQPEMIAASANKLSSWLLKRGFKSAEASVADIEQMQATAEGIMNLSPNRVECVVYPEASGDAFDGKLVWNLLHSMGFEWGDMDCFQWADETGQTDYLIWVEVSDNAYGYAIPEYIAAGSQHFNAVSFSFSPARSPAPLHVLGEMLKATAFFQKTTDCLVAARIDGEIVDDLEPLVSAVTSLVEGLQNLGVMPGSSSVCMLR